MRRSRAATLVELMVYMAVAALVMTAVLSLFRYARRGAASASSGFALGQDAARALLVLRRDLQETSLSSIRYYPKADSTNSMLVMASARDDKNTLHMTQYGVLQWCGYVGYAVLPNGEQGLSKLVRWQVTNNFVDRNPTPPTDMLAVPASARTVVPNLVSPGFQISADAGVPHLAAAATPAAAAGGFVVGFVRRDSTGNETLSASNPNQITDTQQAGWSAGTTGLVDVEVTVAESNMNTGKLSYVQLPLRVAPRN